MNRDHYLIARALYGLETGRYKNYSDAARQLATKAKTLVDGKPRTVASYDSDVDRLRREISKAQRDNDPATPVNIRLKQLREDALSIRR